ncbi:MULTISPECIES: DUF4397 domain-containing protein [Vibrio]|jgi:hypothetical protein|uniref:DUF4397 domain-containing protein n=1 Tax=Vibrio TaxID=662 RepID=UPI000BFF8F54|nr:MULTISPECIES: DUF4397 domain-containing protein [unclassified Vibrio]PHJ41048.1 2-dehydropantoate 2-reductase [Vibrio sp. PID17_43]RIZ57031.1 2-dehydropantoate 2-reductase [Vibrio sp. PID23_8]
MNGFSKLAVTVVAVLGISACGSDSDSKDYTYLQAVHASPDAPRANVLLNGNEALSDLDYGSGSGYVRLEEGTYDVAVDVQLPGGQTAEVINAPLYLDDDILYTAFVVGSAADGSVEPLIVTRSEDSMANNQSLDVQVVHAATGVTQVNVFVTTPDADLTNENPVATLAYTQFTNVLNIPDGEYQIRLTDSSDAANTPVFDSGPLTLAPNSNLTVAAINKGGSVSESPVKLLVLDGEGSTIVQNVSNDSMRDFPSAESDVRVGHLVNGAPNVDVSLDGTTVLSDVAFKTISTYQTLASDSYQVQVDAQGIATPIISADLAFAPGNSYSVYAIGLVSDIEALVVEDNRRSIATSAVLNVTHAAANPAAATVDVYLTQSQDISSIDPAIANFAYKDSVQNIYVAAGDYYVTVTAPGDKTPVIGPAPLPTLENGMVYQAIAIDDNGGFNLLVNDITN